MYRFELEKAVKKYGEAIENCPLEGAQWFGSGCRLAFSLPPGMVRKYKADFCMTVALTIPGGSIVIKELIERKPDLVESPRLLSSSTRDEVFDPYIGEFLIKWILSPNNWKTARDSMIVLYAEACQGSIIAFCA